MEKRKLRLSSANSINWGRLLPQVVYYVSAYADMVRAGTMSAGEPIDVCVPTGNFGNILGAYYAKQIGVPIGRLVCASNENNVLADFIETGVYDIAGRDFVTTPSPSMDILVSSNLERLLSELTSPLAVREWMASLAETGRFEVDGATRDKISKLLVGGFVSNDESLAVIREVWEREGYLLDPHTAVAWKVAASQRSEAPMLVVSTAHWAKFGVDVYKALNDIAYADELPADACTLGGLELLQRVREQAPSSAPIPRGLGDLASRRVRFDDVVDAGIDGVEAAVRKWLG
jgi:threonine synthase